MLHMQIEMGTHLAVCWQHRLQARSNNPVQDQKCTTSRLSAPGEGPRTDEVGELGVLGVAGNAVQLAQLCEVELLQ